MKPLKKLVVYGRGGAIDIVCDCPSGAESVIAGGRRWLRGAADCERHYVRRRRICAYTEAELEAKNNLPPGHVWKMPQRVALDPRTKKRKALDARQAVRTARAAAYPPLADLADALYWQAQGDDSKMQTYLAACAAVKQQFPKEKN
jgi:hypothetical protein